MDSFERISRMMEILSDLEMINGVIKILERPQKTKEKLEEYYEKYPIISWLAQKKYFFGW